MFNFVLQCIVLCGLLFDAGRNEFGRLANDKAPVSAIIFDAALHFARGPGDGGQVVPVRRFDRPLRGDFPEYRPGARAAGRETFWR